MAYYCFLNLGWPPSQYLELPPAERAITKAFVLKDLGSSRKEGEK